MKKSIIFLLIWVGLHAVNASANDVKSILETTWKGRCKQYTDLFQNGYAIIDYELSNMSFNSADNTFTGKMKSDIGIDYVHYIAVMNISGTYNPSNHEIWIYPGTVVREDYLPNGLYWTYSRVRATLYLDANRSGYHLIQGYSVNNNGYNESQIEFSDYPYFI